MYQFELYIYMIENMIENMILTSDSDKLYLVASVQMMSGNKLKHEVSQQYILSCDMTFMSCGGYIIQLK